MTARPRLVFVINSIGMGGAERALDRLLRAGGDHLARYDIRLVLLDDEPERYPLPPLRRHVLGAQGSLIRSARRLDRLLRELRPALVVSFLVRANIVSAIAGPRHADATVLCERMHLGSHLAGRYRGWRLQLLRLLPRLLYRRATRVIAVSQGVGDDLVAAFAVPEQLVRIIPNGYDLEAIAAAAAQPPSVTLPPRFAVAVGRLVAAKNMALLVAAWQRYRPSLPLLILGDGPELERLSKEIAASGVPISLMGYVQDSFAIVGRADFVVSASRNEGFPNAIAEAMALGVPVISSDCPSGPAELLGGQARRPSQATEAPYGLMTPVDDLEALGDALKRFEDPELRARLGVAARQRMETFRLDRVARRYWAELDALVDGGANTVSGDDQR